MTKFTAEKFVIYDVPAEYEDDIIQAEIGCAFVQRFKCKQDNANSTTAVTWLKWYCL
jgi:hypothetical protein